MADIKRAKLARLLDESYKLGLSHIYPHNFKVWKEQEMEVIYKKKKSKRIVLKRTARR